MTTKTRKSVSSPKKGALPARVARRTVAAKSIETRPIEGDSGLKGKGLLQLGSESKLELRDRLSMPRPLFGRVVNVSERTIAKVESETDTAEKLKRPYNEVYRLLEALGDVVEVNSLGNWFQEPNDAF